MKASKLSIAVVAVSVTLALPATLTARKMPPGAARALKAKAPQYRIVRRSDFDVDEAPDVVDGGTGAVVVGRFNYDRFVDAAALVVGPPRIAGVPSSRPVKLAICYGGIQGTYQCVLKKTDDSFPLGFRLERIPPGTYNCPYDDTREEPLVTTVDSIGRTSEKASWFEAVARDGSVYICPTGD